MSISTFNKPCDLFYNPATSLVWMADAGVGTLYAFATSSRDIWIASGSPYNTGLGAYLYSAGIGTESLESSITNPTDATRSVSLTGAGFNGVTRLIGDGTYLYASNMRSGASNPNLIAIVNQGTGAVVGVCDAGAGNLAMDQVVSGDNLWVATQLATGVGGNVLLFSVAAALAAYPTPVTAITTSATSRPYGALAYDPGTTNVFAGTATPTETTTIAAGSDGASLPQAIIYVASATGFPTSGSLSILTDAGFQTVTYTGVSGATFTGCSGGTGEMHLGGEVSSLITSELLASLNATTLGDVATKSFSLSSTFLHFYSMLSTSDGSIWFGTNAQAVYRITPSTFPGASPVVVSLSGVQSHHLFEDITSSTLVVGNDGSFTNENLARVSTTTQTMVSSWGAPGGHAAAALITIAPPPPTNEWVAYQSLDTSKIVTQEWLGGATYAVGASVVPQSTQTGYFYECTTAGVAGATEPDWPILIGATVTDGQVVWTCAATTSPFLTVGQTITVQGENTSSLEQVTVLAVSPTPMGYASAGPCFLAQFKKTHDAGATIVTGTFPYWWSTQRTLVVVLTAVAAADRETRRKVDEYLRKAATGFDQWAICGAVTTTETGGTIGGVSAGSSMGTEMLGSALTFTNTP